MKIAVVVNSAWNLYNFRLNLLNHLKNKGFEVYLIAPPDEYASRLQEMGFRYSPVSMSTKGANPVRDLLFLWSLYRIYRQIRPNVCLHYTIKPNIYGSFAAAWLRIPALNTVTGLGTAFIRTGFVNKIVKKLYRLAFRRVQMVYFQNEDDRQLFLQEKLVEVSRTEVLPGSGVDLKKFKPEEGTASEGQTTFLMVSRILVDKGVQEYLHAAESLKAQYPQATFTLIGAFDENSGFGLSRDFVQHYVDAGVVYYKPFTDDIASEIHRCDAVVLPSYREGTPKTLLEGAACGKPLLTTTAPGCKDVVLEGVNGFLCEAKNTQDLQRILELFLNSSPELRKKMGQASRKLVEEKYDDRLVIDRYESALNALLNKNTDSKK